MRVVDETIKATYPPERVRAALAKNPVKKPGRRHSRAGRRHCVKAGVGPDKKNGQAQLNPIRHVV